MAIFHDLKKIEIYFPYNTFVSYICQQGIFFSKIYRDGIKNIFHIFHLKDFSNGKNNR